MLPCSFCALHILHFVSLVWNYLKNIVFALFEQCMYCVIEQVNISIYFYFPRPVTGNRQNEYIQDSLCDKS